MLESIDIILLRRSLHELQRSIAQALAKTVGMIERVRPIAFGWKMIALLTVIVVVGCGARDAGRPIVALSVLRVLSAHHGICPPKSNRVFGGRAARLFSAPIEYLPYHCMSYPMAQLLRGNCGGDKLDRNVVFITLDKRQRVRFTQDGYELTVQVKTFGENWDPRNRRAALYFSNNDFPKLPRPPGSPRRRYEGPEMYGEFGISGDPLSIASSECPAT